MKKIIVLLLLIFMSTKLSAQFDAAGGMGISFVNNSSLKDYININFAAGDNISTFFSTVEGFAEVDYSLNNSFQVGLDYSYQYFSYNTSYGGIGQFVLNYAHHKPSLLAYYVISGLGYKFKMGGGVGPRFIDLDETLPSSVNSINYSKTGFGFLARLQGHTLLGGSVYANIGIDARFDAVGEPQDSNSNTLGKTNNQVVDLNSLSVSIKVGVSYFF